MIKNKGRKFSEVLGMTETNEIRRNLTILFDLKKKYSKISIQVKPHCILFEQNMVEIRKSKTAMK